MSAPKRQFAPAKAHSFYFPRNIPSLLAYLGVWLSLNGALLWFMAPRKTSKKSPKSKAKQKEIVWIASRGAKGPSELKIPDCELVREPRPKGVPTTSRYLELADIALGLKKPTARKQPRSFPTHDLGLKIEPYSNDSVRK